MKQLTFTIIYSLVVNVGLFGLFYGPRGAIAAAVSTVMLSVMCLISERQRTK